MLPESQWFMTKIRRFLPIFHNFTQFVTKSTQPALFCTKKAALSNGLFCSFAKQYDFFKNKIGRAERLRA